MSSEAIYGLVGVIVGGVIQGGGTWLLARRSDRMVARGAARMTAGELMRAMHRMTAVMESKVWGDVVSHPIVTERWREHEPLFAASITDHERWLDAYNGYRYCQHVNEWAARTGDAKRTLTAEQLDEVDRAIHLVIRGAMVLSAVGIYGPGRWSASRRWERVRAKLRPQSDDAMMDDVARRLDPRLELPDEMPDGSGGSS